jgi:CelD/BcsL family acetyltransferase involved in cellulose biosynthesis
MWHSGCWTITIMPIRRPASTKTTQSKFFAAQNGTAALRVRTLVSFQDMLNNADIWTSLDQRSTAENRFFQSYNWCKNWIEHHATANIRPLIIMVLQGDEAVAILPFMREKLWGFVTVARPLGEPHTQYGGLLTVDGRLDSACVQLMRQALFEQPHIDAVVVKDVPSHSPVRDVLGRGSTVVALANIAAQFDLKLFHNAASYDQALPTRRRQTLRRAIAALKEDGPLTLDVIWPSTPGFDDAVRRCLDWKKTWLTQTGRVGAGLNAEGHTEFLSAIPADAHHGGAVVCVLKAGARPVAYQLGFLQHGQYYLYTASFDWQLRRWSLGTVLLDKTVSWLIDENISTFDLMGNPAPYKETWSNRSLHLTGHIISITTRGAVYASLWSQWLRPTLKTLYHKVPQPLRARFVRSRNVVNPHA